MEENKYPDILFTGFIRDDGDGTYSCVLSIAGIQRREDALKIGLQMSGPVENALAKTFGKFRKYDTLTKGLA